MKTEAPSTRSTPTPATVWIMHMAFINALIIYGVVVWVIKPQLTRPDLSSLVFYSLIGLSLVLIAVAQRLPDMIPAARAVPGETAAEFLGRQQVRMILMDACIEAGGVLGTAACFVGVISFVQLAVLLGIGVLALLAMIPRISGWMSESRGSFETAG